MTVQRRRQIKLGPLTLRLRVSGKFWYCLDDGTPVVCADELFYVMELKPGERPQTLTLRADTQRPQRGAFVDIIVEPNGIYQWTDGIRTSERLNPSPALHLTMNDITRYGFKEFFAWVIINDPDW